MKGINPFRQQVKAALLTHQRKFVGDQLKIATKAKIKIDGQVKYLGREMAKIKGEIKKRKKWAKA